MNIERWTCEMKIDLHIHSRYSHDGVLDPAKIVEIAKRIGLGGIAITDHNTIKGGEEAKQYESEDFQVIIGAEIMTEKGEIIGLFLTKEINSRVFERAIGEIREQNGMVVIPHPFDALRKSAFRITEQYISLVDAIEGFNSRCVLQMFNRKAIEFAHHHKLPVVGGSDAHYANEVGLGGIITSSDNIRQAILRSELEPFGKRSSLFNHARTKIQKLRTKAAQ